MNPPATLRQITFIGVGLIGGSLALGLGRLGLVEEVVGIDLSHSNLDRVLECGVIDEASDTVNEDNIATTDLVLTATPVSTLSVICRSITPFLKAGTLVSDVDSTKQSAFETFRDCLPEHLPYCVATHLIADSNRSGVLAAQFDLYQGKKLTITPHGREDSDGLCRLESLWQAVGAGTYRMSAAEHDAAFVAVFHMPHLLTPTFVHQVLDHPTRQIYLKFVATELHDLTRTVSSRPATWMDICTVSKNSLLDLTGGPHVQLGVLKNILETGSRPALYRYLEEAKQTRDDWQASQPL